MSTMPFSHGFRPSFQFSGSTINGAVEFRAAAASSLARNGHSPESAAAVSAFYEQSYIWTKNNWGSIVASYGLADKTKTFWELDESAVRFQQSSHLLQGALAMGASTRVVEGLSEIQMVSGAGVLSGLIGVWEMVGIKNATPASTCALSVAKVSLDLVGVVGGGLTFEFGIGGVLAVMSAISLAKDSFELGESCTATVME